MERITQKDLECVVYAINSITDNPQEEYTRTNGKFKANVGNYHLSGTYGGWCLEQTMNEGGGVRTVLHGFVPKKELYNKMQAFKLGLTEKD